jgi:ABC-2 type transport system ATP-binding protein
MSAIEVDRLDMRYGDVVAVQGLSFVAGAGAVTCVLGRNGAGKTSTIEALEGLRRPDGGRLSVLGFDPQRDHAALVLRVGVMLQEVGLPPSVRVGEIARCTADLYPASVDVAELLERLDLTRLERRTVRQLSGGEQRRLALALALVGRPQVAFLDEPTAGVDADGREVIREIIGELRDDGVAVLLTTHDLTEAERVADQFVVIDGGRLRAEGSLDELRSRGGGEPEIRFRAPSGLDTAGLAEHLGGWHHAPVTEISWGEYRVAAQPVPGLIAALTSWLDYYGLPLADLRTGHQTLEDLFLELTSPVDGPPELLTDGSGYPPTVAQPARRPRPSTGEHPVPAGQPLTSRFPTTGGYPAVDDQPAVHERPMTGEHPVTGGYPTTGHTAVGGQPAVHERPTTGEHPVTGGYPVPVAKRFADGYPVSGGFPTTGGYPAVGGQPALHERPTTGEHAVTGGQPTGRGRPATGEYPVTGGQPMGRGRPSTGEHPIADRRRLTGEHPLATGQPTGRGRPATGEHPIAGGQPGARGWPAAGQHPIAGDQPAGRGPATGLPPMAERRRLTGEHPIAGAQPVGRGRPATGGSPAVGGQPARHERPVTGENPMAERRRTTGERPVTGGQPAGPGRPATGELPVAGGRPSGRGRPATGERPVAGGKPVGRGRGGMGRRRRKGGPPPGAATEPLPEPTPPPARYPNVVFRD